MDNGMQLGGFPGMPSPEQTAEPLDNNKQAVDIKGYRVLTQDEKDRMNALKESEARILEQLDDHEECIDGINYRSTCLAREHIQTGFMWAIRAIARPNGE